MTILPRNPEVDPVLAFDQRCDDRDKRYLERLLAEGHTHSRCNRCHVARVLNWVDGECNEYDADTDDNVCGGIYRAIKGAM